MEQLALSGVAAVGRRPWLSNAMFRFTKWGNPFADERFSWPYPMYERMRADGPIAYGRPYRQWFVFGYDEVQEILRSPNTATAPIGDILLSTSRYRKLSEAARANFGRWLLVTDAPEHTRLRAAVSRAFTPRQIERYQPLVANVVDDVLSRADTTGEFDAVADITTKLPIEVISTLLGLPDDRRPWLLSTSREIGGMFEPLTVFDPTSMGQRFAELETYLRSIIDERRREPGDDLISALVASDDDAVLDDDETIAMITFLLFAGHETVTGALGNALIAWADADELRLDRPDARPISFGFGAHHCLGAALARMELRHTIPPLLDALGDYTVDLERTTWKRSFALRGPTALPLRAGASIISS